jgi:hypothetical protein
MNHAEALKNMATERYLLNELSPELRDAFEEHYFECPECAMDVRAAAVFIDEAKEHLPELTGPLATPVSERKLGGMPVETRQKKQPWWSGLLRPALALPVFAALIAIVGYQNAVTLPALRMAAGEVQLAPTVYLHSGSRGAAAPIAVDAKQGIVLALDRPQGGEFASYEFALSDAEGKVVAKVTTPAAEQNANPGEGQATDGTLSLAIPGARLGNGAYTLAIFGVTSTGSRSEIERHALAIHLKS